MHKNFYVTRGRAKKIAVNITLTTISMKKNFLLRVISFLFCCVMLLSVIWNGSFLHNGG